MCRRIAGAGHGAGPRRRQVHAHRLQLAVRLRARPAAALLVGRPRRLARADDVFEHLRHLHRRSGRGAARTIRSSARTCCRRPTGPTRPGLAIIVTPTTPARPRPTASRPSSTRSAKKLPGVKVRMGTMEEFADAILAEKPDLPVVKGEMPDTWIHGCMCDPGGMRIARERPPAHAGRRSAQHRNSASGACRSPIRARNSPAPTKRSCSTANTPGAARRA